MNIEQQYLSPFPDWVIFYTLHKFEIQNYKKEKCRRENNSYKYKKNTAITIFTEFGKTKFYSAYFKPINFGKTFY